MKMVLKLRLACREESMTFGQICQIFNLGGYLFFFHVHRIVRSWRPAGERHRTDVVRVSTRSLVETAPIHRARDPPKSAAAQKPFLRGLFFFGKTPFHALTEMDNHSYI